MYLYVS
jgi:hypothetical protein